ncbi:hypothetical protein CF70_032595 [Cupriavidus sp. SK-3]|uniref:MFS transporter n=1 Tax=Cupriavidus sp. SK-3 TaxID=1470558 RepID=UPI0004473531|nr:MFS transporter [Cupriavidus sp. SK-3]KDP88110.1 hypothetical protein CF70_032595 [Cupriavidus sp. SK-3]
MKKVESGSDFISERARCTYWLFTLATFCIFLSGSSNAFFAPVLLDARFSEAQVGMLLSSGAIPVVLCTLLAGACVQRYGPGAVIRVGVAMIFIGFVLFQFAVNAASLPGTVMAMMMLTAGVGAFMPTAFLYVRMLLTPRRLVRYVGIYSAMLQLPTLFGPLFAQYVFEHWGRGRFFLVASIPCGIAMLWLGLTQFRREGSAPVVSSAGHGYLDTVRRGLPWGPNVAGFAAGMLFGAVNAFIAVALMRRGVPVTYFFTAFATGYLAMRGLMAFLDELSKPAVICIGIALMIAGIASAMSDSGGSTRTIVGGCLFGLGYSVVYPLCTIWVSESFVPEQRSRPVAIFNAIFTFSVQVAPLFASLILQVGGMGALRATLVIGGGATVLGLLLHSVRAPASRSQEL